MAQEWEGDENGVEDEADLPTVPRADVADARELLSRPAEDCALFSAEAAGVQPPGLAAAAPVEEPAAVAAGGSAAPRQAGVEAAAEAVAAEALLSETIATDEAVS